MAVSGGDRRGRMGEAAERRDACTAEPDVSAPTGRASARLAQAGDATVTARLRPMRWWDIDAVLRLEKELFADDAWSDTMFWSELALRDSRLYLVAATDDDEVVGYAGLCAYTREQAYVQTIGVSQLHQRDGVGTGLLRAL